MLIGIKDKNDDVYLINSITDKVLNTDVSDLVLKNNLTVWKDEKRNIYLGCTFMSRSADYLKYIDLFKDVDEVNGVSIMTEVVPRLKEILGDMDALDSDGDWDNDLVIAYGNNMFVIDRFFTTVEVPEYFANGYSSAVFIGVLDSTSHMSAKERAKEAIGIYDEMRTNCSFPLAVYNVTKDISEIWWSYDDACKKCNNACNIKLKSKTKIVLDMSKEMI